jgi:hypothetical protein
MPLIDVTYDRSVGEAVLRRLGELLPAVVGEAVECPEDPSIGPEQPGDVEIRFREKSPLDVGELDVVIEVRTKNFGLRVQDKQRRADLIRDRLSHLPLGQVGVWLILSEGAWSQNQLCPPEPGGQGPVGGLEYRSPHARLYGGPVASVKQFQVTFDCAEPERVARFWCEVLGYVVPPPPEGFATWDDFDRSLPPEDQGSWFACIDPSGVGPRLYFQRVPEGKVVKNRLHLDVRVGTGLVGEQRLATLEAECARLVALGAVRMRLLPADDDNESCIVMQDIEGNEFDLD